MAAPLRVSILGGGVSGLSCGWFLKQWCPPNWNITVHEAQGRLGGWMETQPVTKNGNVFPFEAGPQSLIPRRMENTFEVIRGLGIGDQVELADPSAAFRYIYKDKQLLRLPTSVFEVLSSPLMRPLPAAILRDLTTSKGTGEDESVHSFISRRLSPQVAEMLMDPMLSGIYAGDIRKLSARATFPVATLVGFEESGGGIIKGALRRDETKTSTLSLNDDAAALQELEKGRLYTFSDGVQTITNALADQLTQQNVRICQSSRVEGVRWRKDGGATLNMEGGHTLDADVVISALPSFELARLTARDSAEEKLLKEQLDSIRHASLGVVSVGYDHVVDKPRGFGHLIPSSEKETVLGMVYSSDVFPQLGDRNQTRLTVMLGGDRMPEVEGYSESRLIDCTLDAIKSHLGVQDQPAVVVPRMAKKCIAQYEVGHLDVVQKIEESARAVSPNLYLGGASLHGVAINDCITRSKNISKELSERYRV